MKNEPKGTRSDAELWSEFNYYNTDQPDLSVEDTIESQKSRKVQKKLWKEFNKTPAFAEDGESPELTESQAFKLDAMRALDDAFRGNHDHPVYLDRSRYILEQLGIANEDTDPALFAKAHQAYYLAFHLADVDFTDGSGDVEGTFNQRALNGEEYRQAGGYARERLDADPEWERKLYTALSLFTETPAERYVAQAVFSMAIMQIAHWEIDQSSIGEIKRLGIWHLRQQFGELATSAAKADPVWASKIKKLEVKLQTIAAP